MPGRSRFQVHWTDSAQSDLAAVVDSLAEESPEAADAILDRLEGAAARVERLPRRGRVVPELKEQGIVLYREVISRPWRIIFRIEGRDVWITALIDGRRNLEDILLERFLN